MVRARLLLPVALVLGTVSLAGCGGPRDVDCNDYLGAVMAPDSSSRPQIFNYLAVDYFLEIAFGSEYGGGSQVVHRWTDDIRIGVHGDPSVADLITLCEVVLEINTLVDTVEVSVVGSDQNVNLHFEPQSRFGGIEPSYVPGNVGFFYVWWDSTGSITEARVLVSTDLNQTERNHIIREEVTQILGLMKDSYSYSDSIFYQPWSEVQEYSVLDQAVIQILYLPEIIPGMTPSQARAVIPSL